MRATQLKAIGGFCSVVLWGALRWRDADGVGAAGADGAAWGWLELFVEADFDGGEVVVAAAEGER